MSNFINPVNFINPANFINPVTPIYNKGCLVIESDDGYASQLTHWHPIFKQKSQEYYNQWAGHNSVVGCIAVNSQDIGNNRLLNLVQLRELRDFGYEILSHGRYHVGLGVYSITAKANSGQKRIDMDGTAQIRVNAGYSYKISDGVNSENIIPAFTDANAGYMLATDNLQNTYEIGSLVQLTDESAEDLLQGCIDDLTVLGFNVKNHVYAYHSGSDGTYFSEKALTWVGEYFVSGRGKIGLVDPQNADLRALKSILNTTVTREQIEEYLDTIAENNWLMIFYGHSETDSYYLEMLKYLIDGAFSRGIRITTRQKALEIMKLI
jgi:hypothetical protein